MRQSHYSSPTDASEQLKCRDANANIQYNFQLLFKIICPRADVLILQSSTLNTTAGRYADTFLDKTINVTRCWQSHEATKDFSSHPVQQVDIQITFSCWQQRENEMTLGCITR